MLSDNTIKYKGVGQVRLNEIVIQILQFLFISSFTICFWIKIRRRRISAETKDSQGGFARPTTLRRVTVRRRPGAAGGRQYSGEGEAWEGTFVAEHGICKKLAASSFAICELRYPAGRPYRSSCSWRRGAKAICIKRLRCINGVAAILEVDYFNGTWFYDGGGRGDAAHPECDRENSGLAGRQYRIPSRSILPTGSRRAA